MSTTTRRTAALASDDPALQRTAGTSMRAVRSRTRQLSLVVTGLVLVVASTAWTRPDAVSPVQLPMPHLELLCELDLCVVEASYVLPVRYDDHDVTFRWQTAPSPGYPNNGADVLRRTVSSGVGEADMDGSGYRYAFGDFVWHSDIRCDDAVTVRLTSSLTAPASVTTDKPIPTSPPDAFCSAYGIGG